MHLLGIWEFEEKDETQLMADLPSCRLQPYTPFFSHTARDYFGRIKVKLSRNKTKQNIGVIFTQQTCSSLCCELVTDASNIDFLQVFLKEFRPPSPHCFGAKILKIEPKVASKSEIPPDRRIQNNFTITFNEKRMVLP